MIYWPCILKLDGDDELIYLNDKSTLINEYGELILCDDDYIIDSAGYTYLVELASNTLTLLKTGRMLMVDEVTQLIRANEFKKSELCLTKIHFISVSDAIKSANQLALLNEI